MLQVMALNDAYGEEKIGILPVILSLVGIKSIFGLILLFFSGGIARILFKGNEAIYTGEQWTAYALTRAALPLTGVYFLVKNLPYFLTSSVAWMRENAAPSGMPPQHGEDMLHASIAIILSLLLIQKSEGICRLLHRRPEQG